MVKGITATSSPIQVSKTFVSRIAFESNAVDLMLNALDREVFVVTALDFEWAVGENDLLTAAFPPLDTADLRATISSTVRTSVGSVGDTNVLAGVTYGAYHSEPSAAVLPATFNVIYEQNAGNAPPADLSYIGIIATSDFFINTQRSDEFASDQKVGVRVYGYRASVDGSTYAALVQSQVLSS